MTNKTPALSEDQRQAEPPRSPSQEEGGGSKRIGRVFKSLILAPLISGRENDLG